MPYLCIPSERLTPGTVAGLPTLMAQIRHRIDAAIRRHPGGYAAVAQQLGQTEKSLTSSIENLQRDKGQRSTAKLGLADSQRIADITGDGSWVQDIAHFHGFELVALPSPTCDSMDPAEHAANVLHSLGLYLVSLTPSELREPTFKAMDSVGRWAALVSEMAGLKSISINQRTAIRAAHLDVLGQPTHCPLGTVKLQFWLQLAADAKQATDLLESRCSPSDPLQRSGAGTFVDVS